jgi:decaprenylphospho-beta-D-erythro-pentofuranosid-2-ulose 2-reductase
MKQRKIVVVGATSAIAEHCARLWLKDSPADLTLLGRDIEKTQRVASDLLVRSPQSSVRVLQADFMEADAIRRMVDGIVADGAPDIVLIAHGTLPDQADCQDNLEENRDALMVNGISPVLFAEAFAGHMQKAATGTLAIIGSVAGDRGRKSNYIYGAAKGLVTRYAQGLQHRLAGTGVTVVLIKPGPTYTPMTAHLPKSDGFAKVEDVAAAIVKAVASGKPVCYAPAKWALIMMIIRHLPSVIFNKMNI